MATITAAMVKDLRESTGAGMMDCKAALTENDGNMEAAQDWLRKKGLSKAAKVGDVTIDTAINDAIATIGENMTLRRAAQLEVSQGVVSHYVHGAVIEGSGKMGVLVALESPGKADELAALGRQIAMHVDRKSTRLNSSHIQKSRMPSSA